MVTALYLTSIEPAGKTALCAGIGKDLIKQGKKVGYFIPVKLLENNDTDIYRDATFIKETLGLEEYTDKISPIHLTPMDLWQELTENTEEFIRRIKNLYAEIAGGKDIVIIEGPDGLVRDGTSTLACYKFSDILNARVIIVLRYSDDLKPEFFSRVKEELKGYLAGVIINFVPENKLDYVKENLSKLFEEAGIKVLGMLPENRSLLGVTVGELAKALGGTVLTAPGKMNEMVENIMLGAMTLDSGISYFSRKLNKAAIIRSERSDMQLAALETSTSCIVLTGNAEPIDSVIYQAETRKVPIISVKKETMDVIAGVEKALSKNAFNNQHKLKKFQQISGKYLDFKPLYMSIGLTS